MRIQHNIMAMNSYRNYTNNTGALSKNLEKLSSGYKINRAGDDAAGLAISEKMRAQIQGLSAAQKNVKDGISLVKTAEGAMQEIQDMLSRMKYLATQSANGTYDNEVDRNNLQMEVDELLEEINRIADNANFNDIKLLNGDWDDGSVTLGGGGGGNVANFLSEELKEHGLEGLSMKGLDAEKVKEITIEIKSQGTAGVEAEYDDSDKSLKITITKGSSWDEDTNLEALINRAIRKEAKDNEDATSALEGVKASIAGESFDASAITKTDAGKEIKALVGAKAKSEFYAGSDANPGSFGIDTIDLSQLRVDKDTSVHMEYVKDDDAIYLTIGKKTYTAYVDEVEDGGEITFVNDDDPNDKITATATDPKAGWASDIADAEVGTLKPIGGGAGGGLSLQIGDSAGENLAVAIGDMHTSSMGLTTLDISTAGAAKIAMDTVKDAINYVSSVRGKLGATQNRLEHTQNNLSVMAENIQDAESTIRDTDVADEMMGYVKNNILVQSAQAMLAQANQVPQGVLQLLG